MSATLQRRTLTDLILTTLATVGKPVGDMEPPAGWGWQGQPNAPTSTFEPFMVLSTMLAGRAGGPFADSQADWQVPYLLESFGSTRAQAEWMADHARTALDTLRHTTIVIGPDHYRVQQIRTDSIGAVSRVAVTDPPFYGLQDGLTLWISKEL